MRIPRIFTPQQLGAKQTIQLDEAAANHVSRVLRMGVGRRLFLFNGQSESHFEAEILSADRKKVSVKLIQEIPSQLESPLKIHLGQSISKGDRMEYAIQKAVELGVNEITPIISEHCDIKLNPERIEKKLGQWRHIAIAACEQSGRDLVPVIHDVQKLDTWINSTEAQEKWVLDPRGASEHSIPEKVESACLLIGPEGGLSEQEVSLACHAQFKAKLIGPRILRTETAALTAVCLMQSLWGDF